MLSKIGVGFTEPVRDFEREDVALGTYIRDEAPKVHVYWICIAVLLALIVISTVFNVVLLRFVRVERRAGIIGVLVVGCCKEAHAQSAGNSDPELGQPLQLTPTVETALTDLSDEQVIHRAPNSFSLIAQQL